MSRGIWLIGYTWLILGVMYGLYGCAEAFGQSILAVVAFARHYWLKRRVRRRLFRVCR